MLQFSDTSLLCRGPNENDGSDELMCSICFDLAVDAVQVSCCGALHCRACISKCTAWEMCRNPVPELVPVLQPSIPGVMYCERRAFSLSFEREQAPMIALDDGGAPPRCRLLLRQCLAAFLSSIARSTV